MRRDVLSLDQLLLGYAAGRLGTAESLVVAALLALNADARRAVEKFEAMGGRVIEEEDPADVCTSCLEEVLRRIAGSGPSPAPVRPSVCDDLPEPLRSLISSCAEEIELERWRHARGGARTRRLRANTERGLHVLEMPPGCAVPPHSHAGVEITLVLEGAYSDALGVHRKGDIAIVADERLVHSPTAGPEGCVCLVLTEGPLRFAAPVERIIGFIFRV
jgi:putative transcriptional regulator